SLRPQLFAQETFLEPRLDPEAECDQNGADDCVEPARHDGGGDNGGDDAGINGMADDRVGARVDHAMVGLPCDRTRPQPAEIKPGPPGEEEAAHGDCDKEPFDPGAQTPEPIVVQPLEWAKKQDRTR